MENDRAIYDQFKIRIAGVVPGDYRFSIDCNKRFFELSTLSSLQDGLIQLQIDMKKGTNMLSFAFHFCGNVTMSCDRCLDPVSVEIKFDTQLLVKLVERRTQEKVEMDEDDDIWVVNDAIVELDLFHYAYETILLALPHKIVHPDGKSGMSTCNPEMLKKISQLTVEEPEEIDPRWDALKKLIEE